MNEGAFYYIQKPFRNDELIAILKRAGHRDHLVRRPRLVDVDDGPVALVGRRRQPGLLVALLLAGYLLVWGAFGLGAWLADRGVHAAVDALPWLASHPQVIMATTLAVAGLWQFSPLRDRCLDECRSPLGFVLNRWRGTSERREAMTMGIAHGAFCVGCCWSLMLVMFGVGVSSVSAMLALGGLTAIEKNLPWGRRLTRPLGVALVLAAVYVIAS